MSTFIPERNAFFSFPPIATILRPNLVLFMRTNEMKTMTARSMSIVGNIPKNLTAGELTNGYKIRRAAIDLNIPLITNARLASAFINAFCTMSVDDLQIKSWAEYK